VIALLILGAVWAIRHLQDASGLPMLAVLGTVAAWYVGDAFYNDYANNHAQLFESGILQAAWWQVAWFLMVFFCLHRGCTNGSMRVIFAGAVACCNCSIRRGPAGVSETVNPAVLWMRYDLGNPLRNRGAYA